MGDCHARDVHIKVQMSMHFDTTEHCHNVKAVIFGARAARLCWADGGTRWDLGACGDVARGAGWVAHLRCRGSWGPARCRTVAGPDGCHADGWVTRGSVPDQVGGIGGGVAGLGLVARDTRLLPAGHLEQMKPETSLALRAHTPSIATMPT